MVVLIFTTRLTDVDALLPPIAYCKDGSERRKHCIYKLHYGKRVGIVIYGHLNIMMKKKGIPQKCFINPQTILPTNSPLKMH